MVQDPKHVQVADAGQAIASEVGVLDGDGTAACGVEDPGVIGGDSIKGPKLGGFCLMLAKVVGGLSSLGWHSMRGGKGTRREWGRT